MSPLMDAFTVDLKKSAAAERSEEVEQRIREKLAADVQRELRTQADPGLGGAGSATVQVKATETGMVITSENPAAVIEEISRQTSKQEPRETKSIEDLFTQSSGVPELVQGPDGTQMASFRTISLEDVFDEKRRDAAEFRRNTTIQRAVENSIGDRVEEAVKEVDDLYGSGF